MSIEDDIRTPGHFDNDPAAYSAMQYVCGLSPQNYMRFVRMSIEVRETIHQKAITDAGAHVRRSLNPEG